MRRRLGIIVSILRSSMFEGIFFQFPKLGFILFFFLACEALCPLRTNPIYFPRPLLFGSEESKPPLWMWIAKWAMISFFIVALMSPVREIKEEPRGYDILLILDSQSITTKTTKEIEAFIRDRKNDRFALYIPALSPIILPLTKDHDGLIKILQQVRPLVSQEKVTRQIERFFSTAIKDRSWIVLISSDPKQFVQSLPVGIEISVIDPRVERIHRVDNIHIPFIRVVQHKYFDYFYIYPLFLGFLSMLICLYGRNEKGLL